MVDAPNAAESIPSTNNPRWGRREAIRGNDLLADGSTSARKLAKDAFPDDLLRSKEDAGQTSGPAHHTEPYKAQHEAGVPKEGERPTVARGGHNHDYQYVDERDTLSSPSDTAPPYPVTGVTSAPYPPLNAKQSRRVVSWSYSEALAAQPCRIFGQFSADGGTTWTPLKLIGVARAGVDQFVFDAPPGLDFSPTAATPAQDRYVVRPVNSGDVNAAARIVRTGYDGKIAEGLLPASVILASELEGIHWKQRVLVATTGNISLSGTQVVDGVSVVAGQTVLVRAQTAPAENGLWVCAAGAWVRDGAADTWAELAGMVVAVSSGTLYANTIWWAPVAPGGTLGTTAVTISQIYPVAEDDLSLSNNTTGDVSTARHGFAPIAPNDGERYLNGANPPAYTNPTGRWRAQYRYTTGAGATHTPQSGTTRMRVRGYGGGGGGGGVSTAAAQASGAGGGGAGGKFEHWYTNPAAMTYSVGAGGTAGAAGGGNGGAGGNTTFDNAGAILTAFGGSGGTGQVAGTGIVPAAGGAGGAVSTGANQNGSGAPGAHGVRYNAANGAGGAGGSNEFGGGGAGTTSASGVATAGVAGGAGGGGGSGASSANVSSDQAGGAGGAGLIIIDEYY